MQVGAYHDFFTIPSAHAWTIAVFTTAPLSRKCSICFLTCASNSLPSASGRPFFFLAIL